MILDSIEDLLNHIKEVQVDVRDLSTDSLLKMSDFIQTNNLEVDDNIAAALQYQDIITQQLNATVEVIDSMNEKMKSASKTDNSLDMSELEESLAEILAQAKENKSRFSGKLSDENSDDEIEFF